MAGLGTFQCGWRPAHPDCNPIAIQNIDPNFHNHPNAIADGHSHNYTDAYQHPDIHTQPHTSANVNNAAHAYAATDGYSMANRNTACQRTLSAFLLPEKETNRRLSGGLFVWYRNVLSLIQFVVCQGACNVSSDAGIVAQQGQVGTKAGASAELLDTFQQERCYPGAANAFLLCF